MNVKTLMKTILVRIAALFLITTSSVSVAWFWDKPKSEKELQAKQALETIQKQEKEERDVRKAQDKVADAKAHLNKAKEEAKYAAGKVK